MKYKVGDKVKVRENLLTGRDYNGLYYSTGMAEFEGKESEIKDIYSDYYYLDFSDEYGFTDDMLEPVEDVAIVKEYTFLEVVINIEDNETYTSDSPVYVIESIKKENGNIKFFYHGACNDHIGLNSNQRFVKIQPTVPFLEAWKAQEEGIEVVSCDDYHYKNNQIKNNCTGEWDDDMMMIRDTEIKGKWQILK